MTQKANLPFILIIAGPTASGKSSFAEGLARDSARLEKICGVRKKGVIINADSAQMFTRLTIGTAKPDWRVSDISHRLFDICDNPVDFDVAQYRSMLQKVIAEVVAEDKVPILVGGSLFYIKSLFYPPLQMDGEIGRAHV